MSIKINQSINQSLFQFHWVGRWADTEEVEENKGKENENSHLVECKQKWSKEDGLTN